MAPQAGLDIPVHVVELDLAEVPVPGPENLLERFILIVEGEAKPAEFSLPVALLQKVHYSQLQHLFPAAAAEAVEEIKVEVVHLEPLHLLGKDVLGLLQAVDDCAGHLGCQIIALSGILGEDAAQNGFALPIVVEPGGVVVGDPGLHGPVNQLSHLLLIHRSVLLSGKAHTAVAQQGGPQLHPRLFHAVVHQASSSSK